MDINEIKDIMDIASKLQASFRHIKYLCGKYEELQKGNSFEPYNNYPFVPGNYGPPPPYSHEPYYQTPYNINYGYPPQNILPHYPINTFPVNKIQEINDSSKINKIPMQQDQIKKMSVQQKKLQSKNNLVNHQNKSISSNGKTPEKKQSSSEMKGFPQSPYHVFLKSKKNQIKNEYPHLKQNQLLQIMLQVWKSFTDKQKKPYELEFTRLKSNFLSRQKNQNSSSKPDYLQIAKTLKNGLNK